MVRPGVVWEGGGRGYVQVLVWDPGRCVILVEWVVDA